MGRGGLGYIDNLLRGNGFALVILDTAGKVCYAEHVTGDGGRVAGEALRVRLLRQRRPMRRALLAAALLAGCATAGSQRLAERMPAELPDTATIAGWEKFAGQADIGADSVVYELYVNPRRPALYEITRYRLTTATSEETEKVLWNSAPGTGEPLRCFEWIARRTWRTLWLAGNGEWRRMEPGSPAYNSAMGTAIRVYAARNESAAD